MKLFAIVIAYFVTLGVFIEAMRCYLLVNKLWLRKHEKIVAESVSMVAWLLSLIVNGLFFAKFAIIDNDRAMALCFGTYLLTAIIVIAIGSGVWVGGNRGNSFVALIINALKLERSESVEIFKTLLKPKGATQLLTILHQTAAIDKNIATQEIGVIKQFVAHWNLESSYLELQQSVDASSVTLDNLRDSIKKYLDMKPPRDQAAELVDVLKFTIEADKKVAKEEALILAEATGMINHYVNESNSRLPGYEILLVPQDKDQIDRIRDILAGAEPVDRRGGIAFVAGEFHSEEFAEEICNKYSALGLFTTTEKIAFV